MALTDVSGNVVEKYAYEPWGARRNPTDWTQKDSRTSWITNRGYTEHEHLDAFGIINMNGRVYDPQTAMFFSPDPLVQAPGDWLNYNRYGYCFNNPLIYTDPSGYVFSSAAEVVTWLWDHTPNDGGLYYKNTNNYFGGSSPGGSYEITNNGSVAFDWAMESVDLHNYWSKTYAGSKDKAISYYIQSYSQEMTKLGYFPSIVGSNGVYVYADKDKTQNIESLNAGFLNSAVVVVQGGGSGNLSGAINTGVGAFGALNSIGINIARDYVSYGFKSANGWQEFGKLASNQQAWRAASVLGKTSANVLKYAKGLGVAAAVATSIYSGYNTYNYYNNGGTDMSVGIKSALDITMTGVGFLGPIGFGISVTYFLLDTATDGFGEYGKIK